MIRQIKESLEALDKVKEGEPNHDFYKGKVRSQLYSLEPYVDSLETHIKALTAQLEIERKG